VEHNTENGLGKAGREKVLREFGAEVIAKRYIELYQSILDER
jgi:glycosyltransferase involved in cell wall biosynthesis